MNPIKWSYTIQYVENTSKKHKAYHDGMLVYFPSERKALLLDGDGNLLEERIPFHADSLVPGGHVAMERFIIDIIAHAPATTAPLEQSQSAKGEPSTEPAIKDVVYYKKMSRVKEYKSAILSFDSMKKEYVIKDEAHPNLILHRLQNEPVAKIIESSNYIFELGQNTRDYLKGQPTDFNEGLDSKRVVVGEKSAQGEAPVAADLMEFELLFTTDKVKKIKKWIDGRLRWTSILCTFMDEEGKTFFK